MPRRAYRGSVDMTAARSGDPARPRLTVVLSLAVVLLGCAAVAGGVLVQREHSERADAREAQARYGAVLQAASHEAEAVINIRHDEARESIDRVVEGATGEFRNQYTTSTAGMIKVLKANKSVMQGDVVWAGVVEVDVDSAIVIAATSGTVANKETKDEPVARDFRLRLELQRVDGEWLTSDLQFVG